MKNNPTRHKTKNTFKFQTFSERISDIDINVFHKVKHPYEEDDEEVEQSCHFARSLTRLSDDNHFIPEFIELKKKLPCDISLPQLLVRLEEIAGVLIAHLKICSSDSLKPALELIVALAQDVRKEFFPHFCPHVMRECVNLLNTREVEQIDCVFTCLAHLFKCLRVFIIRNINKVLPELLPLLSDSRPLYINNFAAESFAYVARKVIDKAEFLRLCLKNIKNNQETLAGVARLYFEVVKNIGRQFYSDADETIIILLKELDNRKWSNIVYTICNHFVSHVLSFVTPETDVSPLWKSFMAVAEELRLVWLKEPVNVHAGNFALLLKLIQRFVNSSTAILRNPGEFINFIFELSLSENIAKFPELHGVVIEILSKLLVGENFSSKIGNREQIIVKVFSSIQDERFATQFSESLISVPEYETLAFREILRFFEVHGLGDGSIEFLARIVWIKTGFDFHKIEKLKFYSSSFESFPDRLKQTIVSKITFPVAYEVTESVLQAALVACNFKDLCSSVTKRLDAVFDNLCQQISTCDSVEHVAKLLYVLLVLFESRTQYHKETPLKCGPLVKLAMKFVDSSNYLCSLRLLDSLSLMKEESPKNSKSVQAAFERLNINGEPTKLIKNLSSPFHKVRLFTLNVLMKLDIHPIFENMYVIETILPSVTSDRDKLHKLQKLEFNEKFVEEVKAKFLRTAVLKFLIGNLYINYMKFWEPVQKLIATHLEEEENSWIVFETLLLESVVNDIDSEKLMQDFHVDFHCDYLREHFYELNGLDDRPDFYNFRCLLLGVLTNCRKMGFKNSNFLPELFIKFYRSEYAVNVHDFKSSCNIKKSDGDQPNVTVNESQIDVETENESKNKKNLNKVFVMLLKLMNVTSHQTPQNYREELENIHLELLSNGNSDVQQAAVTYITKKRKISHYKDRLLALIKENSFKNELLNLRIDANSDVIPQRDWSDLMNIILRILYEKVRKKSASHLRDAAFEFLADCGDEYVPKFFDMLFKQFKPYVQSSTDPLSYLHAEIDLECTLPPSCLLTYVNTALDLLKRCGKRLSHYSLSYLLKIIFKVAAYVVVLSNVKSEIYAGYHGILSKIRIVTFEAIIFFVENFEYDWSENEIEAVVQYFIEPWIGKVVHECLQSPNPVMKLFIAFSKNPRYFPLLAHKCDQLTPMDALMSLLNSEKVYFNVKNLILTIIEQLLTQEEESEETVISDLMYMDNTTGRELEGICQYGTILLLGHVSTILLYLEKALGKKYIKVGGLYMLILKRVSEMELQEDASVTLLNLLMPALKSKASADEDVVMPLLVTIFNLFKQFKRHNLFEGYLLQLAYLFSIATAPPVRRMLRDMVKYIGEKTGTSYVNADFVYGLNVFDPRFIDQPDYAGVLETYKCINEASEKGELNFYTGIFVIYNAFYIFKNERDMALRDHSGLCLRRICPILARAYAKSSKEYAVLLNDTLLPLIKEGIQDKNESYQSESVTLFGHMVRECPTLHPVFKNLLPLTDAADMDNDFFENIQHLQVHRKTKALKRFTEVLSQAMKPPQPYSLMFVYPLVSRHLLSDKMANETALIHASIEALKIVCRLSSWLHYERILKQYVLEMRKNVALRKQAIRIISAILDSFHFDVSAAADIHDGERLSTEEVVDENAMEVDASDDKPEEKLLPAVKRMTVLCRSDAVRVYKSIRSFLVPSLDRIFMMYDDSEQCHKLNKKSSRYDKEELAVLSIPIAYAAVKLLKRLPVAVLDQYINTIFLKLSTYLKSRLLSIRLAARETMQHILTELGPSYFPKLLSEMMSILTKGFQIHVLVFTCHAILERIQSKFAAGDMDACADPVLEICIVDLFGKLAEEKEVVQISSKTPEAKGNKSYNMLSIMAEYISENRVLDMVLPLKEILSNNMSSKVVGKVSRCLRYIAVGLTRNHFLSAESLLVFAYGVSNDCIPTLVMERENNKVRIDDTRLIEKGDCLLIPEEPKHLTTEKRKVCCRTNAHVIIEFGLELLESMLKREIVKSASYRPHLDPFIPLIADCLQAQHNKLVTVALKCSKYLLRRDLPSLNENAATICESVFTILSKYSSTAVSGENGELIMSAAKVALALVSDAKYTVNDDQLRILLYVVEDLQKNVSHYGTGFALLKAILTRNFSSAEVHELMKKTGELSITAYSENVRLLARKAYYYYLVKYPHNKKKLHDKVEFIAAQLKYEEISGRMSALEMLKVIVSAFPKEELMNLSSLLFFKLACRLIEDDSAECKKMASDCIAIILKRVRDTKEDEELFDTTMNWFSAKKIQCRILALQLLRLFVTEKGEKFASKLDTVLPMIENQLYSGRVDGVGKHVIAPTLDEDSRSETDALIFHVLQLYKVLLELCPVLLRDEKYESYVQRMADNCQSFLKHSHEWVRLGASQVLGLLFKSLDVRQVCHVVSRPSAAAEVGFLLDKKARKQVMSLCQDFCDQLVPGHDIMEELLKQSMKNLLFFAEVLQHVPCREMKRLSLPWLVNKLANKVRKEVAHAPRSFTVRTMVFNWLAALTVKLEEDKLTSLLPIVMLPILRELSTADKQGVVIRRTAKEALKYYRKKVNADAYDKVVIQVQRKLDAKRAQKRMKMIQMPVIDPERAARRKVKIREKKKELRKRRLERLRKRKFKSRKPKAVEIAEE